MLWLLTYYNVVSRQLFRNIAFFSVLMYKLCQKVDKNYLIYASRLLLVFLVDKKPNFYVDVASFISKLTQLSFIQAFIWIKSYFLIDSYKITWDDC